MPKFNFGSVEYRAPGHFYLHPAGQLISSLI